MRTHHGTLAYLHNWPHQLAHCSGLEKGLCPWVPAAGEFPPGLAENAEHRSVSRACSFNKEFCRQKQNIGLGREQQGSAIALQLPEPIGSACKGVFRCQLREDVGRTNVHYSTSFLTPGYLSPNLHGLFMARGKDDFVSKRRFILGSQTEMVSLFLGLKQYIKEVFHSLG